MFFYDFYVGSVFSYRCFNLKGKKDQFLYIQSLQTVGIRLQHCVNIEVKGFQRERDRELFILSQQDCLPRAQQKAWLLWKLIPEYGETMLGSTQTKKERWCLCLEFIVVVIIKVRLGERYLLPKSGRTLKPPKVAGTQHPARVIVGRNQLKILN